MAVFRCSCHQITWGDHMVEALDDIGSFGYAGTETFGTVVTEFAGRAHDFQTMLQARGLRLSALYGGGALHDPAQQREAIAENLAIVNFLHEMGSDRLVIGPARRDGTPTDADIRQFASGATEVAAAARDLGIVTGMHPHWNTVIQERDEITRFFDAVDTDLVKLALDPAHIAKAGDDPVEVASTYRDILTYMHIKDYVPELDVETPERGQRPGSRAAHRLLRRTGNRSRGPARLAGCGARSRLRRLADRGTRPLPNHPAPEPGSQLALPHRAPGL